MSSLRFVGEMIYRHAGKWLLGFSVLGVAGIALGISVDMRILYVSILLLFVVLPMLLALLYYYFGLRREAYVNTMPHSVVLEENGVTMRLRLYTYKDEEEPQGSAEESATEREREYVMRDEFFPFGEMTRVEVGLKSVTIPLKQPAKGFLWIPVSAYEDPDDFERVITQISQNIPT